MGNNFAEHQKQIEHNDPAQYFRQVENQFPIDFFLFGKEFVFDE